MGKIPKDVQDFIDNLSGEAWKGFAIAAYNLAICSGKNSAEAKSLMTGEILRVADKVIDKINKESSHLTDRK